MDNGDMVILEKLFDAKLKPIVELQQEHHRTLFGNGTEGNQGLRVDVDRIKQGAKWRNWALAGIAAPVITQLGGKLWAIISKPIEVISK